MIGLKKNKLKTMQKEAAMANLSYYSSICLEELTG
jgi:hypothetical protein